MVACKKVGECYWQKAVRFMSVSFTMAKSVCCGKRLLCVLWFGVAESQVTVVRLAEVYWVGQAALQNIKKLKLMMTPRRPAVTPAIMNFKHVSGLSIWLCGFGCWEKWGTTLKTAGKLEPIKIRSLLSRWFSNSTWILV